MRHRSTGAEKNKSNKKEKQRCAFQLGPLKFSLFEKIEFFFSSLAVRLLNKRLLWPQTQLPNGGTRHSAVVFRRRHGVTFLFVGIH